MIEEKTQIEELYVLKHRFDTNDNNGYDYEKNLLRRLLSNVMFGNQKLLYFLPMLQDNLVWMIDSVLPIRNWWNYTVSKYYNKHNN